MNISRPPGPRPAEPGLRIIKQMHEDWLGFAARMQRQYGDAVYLPLGFEHEYFFFHPDAIRAVLVENADAFIRWEHGMRVLGTAHGQSVLITEGDVWKRQRRMLQPGFGTKRFDGYAQQIVQAAEQALDALPTDTPVDIEHVMNKLTMDVILRTMFSSSIEADSNTIEKAVRDLSRIGYNEMFLPVLIPDWFPWPGKSAKRSAMRILDDVVWRRIRERRANPTDHQDLLAMLMASEDAAGDGGRLSDREVRDQCMTIFLAGHDTTAGALCWLAWVLASRPDVTRRAAQEVDTVLGARPPAYADIPQLAYVAQVIKETLRLYSPAPGVFRRRAIRDVHIGGWLLPKGSCISILSTVPHRDARWFPDPLCFDPNRFNAERSRQIPRGAYFPFGLGPRVCIGNNFAMMELTLIAAMILQRYEMQPAAGQTEPALNLAVTVRPAGGLRLVIGKRRSSGLVGSTAVAEVDAPARCPFPHASG